MPTECTECRQPLSAKLIKAKYSKCLQCYAEDLYVRYGEMADSYTALPEWVGRAYNRLLAHKNSPSRFRKWYERPHS